jgi:enoyl-CoA hydratase/carnithine racemase
VKEAAVEYQYIKVERDEGVVTLTLNMPRWLNPWLIPMMEEMTVELDHVAVNPEDKVLVITGAGDAFSSGGDVRAMAGEQYPTPYWMKEGPDHQRGLWNTPTMSAEERMELRGLNGKRIHLQVFRLNKPTIAAVNGVAAGAGCDLAMTCDIRIASTTARFIEVYVRRGLTPLDGGAFWAPFHLPYGAAMRMLLTGDALSAEDAYRYGLVEQVVQPEELMPVTLELAHRIARGPSVAQQLTKHMVRELFLKNYLTMWELAEKAGRAVRETKDFEEGVRSFVEKRAPQFKGY